MQTWTRFSVVSILILGWMVPHGWAESQGIPQFLNLGRVDAESDQQFSMVTIRLSGKPEWEKPKISSHRTFLQVYLPNTIVPKPGEFLEGGGPYVTKLATFQVNSQDAAVRIFLKEDAGKVQPHTDLEVLGERLVLTLDHAAIEAATPPLPVPAEEKVAEASPAKKPVDQIVEKTEVPADSIPPATLLQKPAKAEAATQVAGFDLNGKLLIVSIFSGFLILVMLAVYMMRPMLRAKRKARDAGSYIDMKTIATHSLMPKQRLTLVEVCNQKILLAVSPDSVNFITTIGVAEPMQRTARYGSTSIKSIENVMNQALLEKKVEAKPEKPAKASIPAKPRVRRDLPPPQETDSIEDSVKVDLTSSAPLQSPVQEQTAQVETPSVADPREAMDDVTKLIRQKLKSLKAI